jgi:hypothetical protein
MRRIVTTSNTSSSAAAVIDLRIDQVYCADQTLLGSGWNGQNMIYQVQKFTRCKND